jgi:hypothetical protein
MLTRDIEGRFEAATGQRAHLVSKEWLIRYVVSLDGIRVALQRRVVEYATEEAERKAQEYGWWWRRLGRWVTRSR